MKTNASKKPLGNSFYIKEGNRVIKINLHEVIAFESQLHQIIIHTINSTVRLYLTLEKIKQILADSKEFIQVHRSFIISENFIKCIEGNVVELSNETKITIGRLYKKAFEEMIKAKLLR
ncbi:LytR/AlgR family response regulator transcription factor [Pedobacter sp.]